MIISDEELISDITSDLRIERTTAEARKQRQSLRHVAMGILARREHSEQELRRKLLKRFSNSTAIEQVIESLRSDRLLSNRRFAESYTRYRSNAGFGPRRIALELAARGVSDGMVREAMADAQIDWFDVALRQFEKKFGRGDSSDIKVRAKVNQFLYYRGFSAEHIDYALTESLEKSDA